VLRVGLEELFSYCLVVKFSLSTRKGIYCFETVQDFTIQKEIGHQTMSDLLLCRNA
jgi:hypothetical protein